MYCGQCGKRVLDGMLFCPFCGARIVIPPQDGEEATPARNPEPVPQPESKPEARAEIKAEPEHKPAAEAKPAPEPEPETEPVAEHKPKLEPEPKPELKAEPAPRAERGPEPHQRPVSLFDDLDSFDDLGEAKVRQEADEPDDVNGADELDDLDDIDESDEPDDIDELDDADELDELDELDDTDELDGFDEPDEADEPFAPLEISAAFDLDREELSPPRPVAPPCPAQARTVSPRRSAPPGRGLRGSGTFIPVRDVDPNDMFMDRTHPSAEEPDPYDDGAIEARHARRSGGFPFEDAEPDGFLQRHVRGAVGLALLAVLLMVFLVWMILPPGQRVLASANLAWNASVYNQLGNEAYVAGQYSRAANCFERALARDGGNYDYAHSAMVAYYEAGELENSLAMLKRCIDMTPDDPAPYLELKVLYPDPASRPWEVQQLLRQGYERTGEAALSGDGA